MRRSFWTSLPFPPERLVDRMRDIRPADAHILQFTFAHGGELTPDAARGPPSPDAHEHSRDGDQRRPPRGSRSPPLKPAVACRNAAQRLNPPPALASPETGRAP